MERDTLEKSEADGEELAPEQKAKLGVLQSAKKRKSEYERSRYQEKRQKRQEETINQEQGSHLRQMKMAEEVLPKGVTFRKSGKWQVQLFYAGQSRYLGMFPSKEAAAMAYELARDCAIQLGDDRRTLRKLFPEKNQSKCHNASQGCRWSIDDD